MVSFCVKIFDLIDDGIGEIQASLPDNKVLVRVNDFCY